MAKFCIYCGEPLEESSRFCPACGKQVDSRPAAASQGNNAPQGPSWKDMKPKITIGKPQIRFISKGKLILLAIVFVIILVLSLLTK